MGLLLSNTALCVGGNWMTCELCEGKTINNGRIKIRHYPPDKNYLCYWDKYFTVDIKIKYCPMCGRKLDEE